MSRICPTLLALGSVFGANTLSFGAIAITKPAETQEPVAAPATPLRAASQAQATRAVAPAAAVAGYRNGAEEGSAGLVLEGILNGGSTDFSAFSLVQGAYVAQGDAAFRLANSRLTDKDPFTDASFRLPDPINVTADTQLWFFSRLGFATTSQVAKLQVSTDGNSWETLWQDAGNGATNSTNLPQSFSEINLSLAAYAGQAVYVRFLFDYTGGSAFSPTSSLAGWFIDDIQIGSERAKDFYAFGDPDDEETLYLELINRARADANAEAQRLIDNIDAGLVNAVRGVDFDEMKRQFATLDQHLPPVAFNQQLIAAARLHSQDMYNNEFQGHVSSTNPPSPNQPLDDLGDRVQRQGYGYSSLGENVFAYSRYTWYGHAGFQIDWGGDAWHGMQTPPGHRESIHNPKFKEVGVGIVNGTKGSVGPQIVTQDFGAPSNSQSFLTGVVYTDGNGNNFYDPGEGVGNVRIEAESGAYYTLSAASGAYTLPLGSNDGSYTIQFTGEGGSHQQQVTVADTANVKLDWDPTDVVVSTPVDAGVGVTVDSLTVANGHFTLHFTVSAARDFDTAEVQLQGWGAGSFTTLTTLDLGAGTSSHQYTGDYAAGGLIRVIVR
ncbi:MAG: CAP domain-containing protein [Verrucomicrobiota bacterium JB022]|nr:CAP domain-containing protein [Verrucomicrobiota bacterium JB022]